MIEGNTGTVSDSDDLFQAKQEHSTTSVSESGRQAGRERIAKLQVVRFWSNIIVCCLIIII